MVVGLPPFYSKSRTELFDKIKFNNPNVPPYVSQKLKNLLEGLFQKNPQNRLGSKNGASDIKSHPWFEKLDWNNIEAKNIKAPFIPLIKSEVDVSNFDPEFTECSVNSYTEASMKEDDGKAYQGNFKLIQDFRLTRATKPRR